MSDMDEEYDFDYTDGSDNQDDENINIENQYFNSKGLLSNGEEEAALDGFETLLTTLEQEKGEWGFKSLKQMVKLHFKRQEFDKMMKRYTQMLTYIKSAVTRNYSEKCILKILDFVSVCEQVELLQSFYETTLAALMDAKNERLWFKTNLKLGKLWFDKSEYTRLQKILRELHKSCQDEHGMDDANKGTQLLEVFALEIQMCTATKNNKRLKELYQRALLIRSAIPHPLIMGVIHECGGKMHMAERTWSAADTCFFDAFRNYEEAGHPRRIHCLKYLVLAKMLASDQINPFDSPEAKPYKDDKDVMAMTSLLAAYTRNDIKDFERVLKGNRKTIMDDPFLALYVEDLLKHIRSEVLQKLIKPYTRIRVPFVSKELNIPEADVEALMVSLILDAKIAGQIDQVNQTLELDHKAEGAKKYNAIHKWTTQMKPLTEGIVTKLVSY